VSLDSLRRLDARFSVRLQSTARGRLRRLLLSVVAHSGDSAVVLPLLAVLWALGGFSFRSYTLTLAAAYLATVVLTTAMKWAFRRRRPEGEWGTLYRRTDPHSFPSGHASRTVALCLVAFGRGWPVAGVLLLAWSVSVGYARVALGVHYLLDVLGGYLLGIAVGAAAWLLMGYGVLP
jgi:undecaprenyl-diphosphatase